MIPAQECTNSITPTSLALIIDRPDDELESILFARARFLDDTERLSYGEKGLIARTVEAYLLHEKRLDPNTGEPCTFSQWLHLAAPTGHSTWYAAMRDVGALADVPAEQVAKISTGNFPVMRQLSTAVRNDPKVLKSAQTESPENLVEHIRQNHPQEHIEHTRFLRIPFEESAFAKVEEGIEKAMQRGAHSRSEAMEWIVAEAVRQWAYEDEIEKVIVEEPSDCSQREE